MIAIDDILAKGVALNDHLPVNIYKGNTKVAGWHPQTVSGEGTISLDGAYNVPPDALVIDGKCVQTGTPSPDSPAPISTITGNVGITGADGAASDTATVAFGSAVCASLPDGTHDTYDAVTGVLTKRIFHTQLAVPDMDNNEEYPGWPQVTGLSEVFPDINDYVYGTSSIKGAGEYYAVNTHLYTSTSSGKLFLPVLRWGMTPAEWKATYPDLVIDFYLKAMAPQTIQLTPDLPVVRTGIKTLSVSVNITPSFTATVKAMD